MKRVGFVALMIMVVFFGAFPVQAQEHRLIASLEIKPEYVIPVRDIEGFDFSGITVIATHPEITQVSISSSRGVDASFLENLDSEPYMLLFQESILGVDTITISFY